MSQPNTTAEPTVAELVQWLESTVVRGLDIDPAVIRSTRRFDELGVDSMLSASIARELRRKVRQPVSLNALYEFPDIDILAGHYGVAND
jgi:hypothetical protein